MTCRRIVIAALLSLPFASACEQKADSGNPGGSAGAAAGTGGRGGGAGSRAGTGGDGGSATAGSGGASGGGGGASLPPDAGSTEAGGSDAGPGSGDCTGPAATTLACDPLRKMPKTIKETGLFPAAPDFSKHPAAMRRFVPDPPLWSDGLEKERFILLPAGKKIDNTNPTSWVFPVGTVLIKTFFDDGGPGGKPRPIETRFIRRVGTETDFVEYDYYLYQWNAEGTDATLVLDDRNGDDQFAPTVKVTINRMVDGKPFVINNGQQFDHTLPSRSMCGDCHRQNGLAFQTFIGFDEIRLNWKLKDAGKTQLQEFQDADLFTSKPKPGDPPPRTIEDADPRLLKVKRFVLGNCVHCHNDKGMVFDMSPNVFVMNTVGQKTMAQSVQPPRNWLRVYPKMPEMSVVFVQARRTPLPMPTTAGGNRLRPMPPIGVNDLAADPDGVAALRDWITNLP